MHKRTLIFLFIISTVFFTFCRSQKEISNEKQVPNTITLVEQPIEMNGVQSINDVQGISPEEVKQMNSIVKEMASIYCKIKGLESSYEKSKDEKELIEIESQKNMLAEYQQFADSSYQADPYKSRFTMAYSHQKKKCD